MKHERKVIQYNIEGRDAEITSFPPFHLFYKIYVIIQVFNRDHLRPEHLYLEQGIGCFLPALEEAQHSDSARTVAQTIMKSL